MLERLPTFDGSPKEAPTDFRFKVGERWVRAVTARREDERPSKYVMAMYLQARGWRRRPQRPTEHEPRRWVDPWDCEGDLRVEQAYDLQQRREKGDAGE